MRAEVRRKVTEDELWEQQRGQKVERETLEGDTTVRESCREKGKER